MKTRLCQRLLSVLIILAMLLPGPVNAVGLVGGPAPVAAIAMAETPEEQGGGQAEEDLAGQMATEGGPEPAEDGQLPLSLDGGTPQAMLSPNNFALLGTAGNTTVVTDIEYYWHVDQVQSWISQSAFWGVSLGSGWENKEAQLLLQDSAGRTVGCSDVKRTDGFSGGLYVDLFTEAGLAAGDYQLRAASAAGDLHPTWSRTLHVTDSRLILSRSWTGLGGGSLLPGDTDVLIQISALGVDDPAGLELQLLNPSDGVPVFVQSGGVWLGRNASGASELLYRLQAVDGYQAEQGVLYDLSIAATDGGTLVTQAHQVWTITADAHFSQLEVLDAAIARFRVALQSCPDGMYTAELLIADQSYSWTVLDTKSVKYDGSGSLIVQFDDQDNPLCLTGTYMLRLTQGALTLESQQYVANGQLGSLPERYEQAALVSVGPASISRGQSASITGRVANLGAGAVQLELVQVDGFGRMQRVPGLQPVALTAAAVYDPLAYRFVNYYQVQGSFPVPADLPTDQEYRWLVTCNNLSGETRGLLSVVGMRPGATSSPSIGRVEVVDAPSVSSGHGAFSMMPQHVYYIGRDTTSLSLLLHWPQQIADLNLLSVVLQDGNGAVVGNLRAGSVCLDGEQISCQLNVSSLLSATAHQLVVSYAGQQLATTDLQVRSDTLLSTDAVYVSDAQRSFASGQNFTLSFAAALNVEPTLLQVRLLPLAGGSKITPALTASRDGLRLTLACIAGEQLQGLYSLELWYGGEAMQTLDQDGELSAILPRAICFAPGARVNAAASRDGGYSFQGSGFAAGTSYTAMLHRQAQPTTRTAQIPLTRVSESELALAAADLPSSWKGQSQIIIFGNGSPLPVSQPLLVILQPTEMPVLDPTATVNNGAAFTFDPEVTVNVLPGTFGEMRHAASQAGLANQSYLPSASFVWNLGEEYGLKQVYLQFRDTAGRERLLTVSIEYLSRELPEPIGYGLSASLVCDGQPLTIWVKSRLPLQVQAKLVDGEGRVLGQPLTLARTGLEYGVSTYSRTTNVSANDHAAAQTVELSLLEPGTGRSWSTELPLSLESRLFISQTQTEIQRVYSYWAYAKQQSPIKYSAAGSPGLTEVEAVLIYDTKGESGVAKTVTLTETANGSGIYQGQDTIPDGATYLTQVEYQLASDLQASTRTEPISLAVAGSVRFADLPAGGDYTGFALNLSTTNGWVGYQATVSGHDPVQFGDVPPGSYRYSVSDGKRIYASGDLSVTAGQNATLSLAQALVPARLTIGTNQPEVKGQVACEISREDRTWKEYLPLGGTLSGLATGDAVRYLVQIDYPAGLSYYKPTAKRQVVLSQANESITYELQPISRVTVNGRVIDELFAEAANPKTVAVPAATVYLEQALDNGGTWVYNNQSVTTDADGKFSLSVFGEVGGTLRVRKPGYADLDCELSAVELQSDELSDLLLRYLTTGYLTFQLLVAPAAPDAAQPGYQPDFLPAAANSARINSVKRADGSPVYGGYSYANNRFYFSNNHGLAAGDTITVQVWTGDRLQLVQSEFTLTLDPHISAQVTAQAIAPGEIQGTASNAAGYPVHTLLFDSTGGSRIQIYSGSAFSTHDLQLAPGDYALVYISGDDLQRVQRISRLSQLQELQLTAGVHYAARSVSLTQGRITDLGEVVAPTVTDDQLGYLSTDGTGVAIKPGLLTEPGRTRGTITLRYSLPERLRQQDYRVTSLEVSLPTGSGKIVSREYYLNGAKGTANYDNYISVPVDDEHLQAGVLQFDLALESSSQVELSATATIFGSNRWSMETIFQGTIDLPLLTISAPEEVLPSADGRIKVSGIGYIGQTIKVFDNGTLVGQAVTDQRGRWEAMINLSEPRKPQVHTLTATMQADEQELTAAVSSRVIFDSVIRVEAVRVWQPYMFDLSIGFTDGVANKPMTINPSREVLARFKLVNANPDDVAYAGLVNEFRGQTTLYEATYQPAGEHAGFWLVDGLKLSQPGTLSVAYAMKLQSDPLAEARTVAQLTNTRVIDIGALPDSPQLDVNTLPSFLQDSVRNAATLTDLVVQNDPTAPYLKGDDPEGDGSISATLELGAGRRLALSGSSQAHSGDVPAGYIRIDTEQGPYWVKSPDVTVGDDSITVHYRAYFSQQLWAAVSPSAQPAGRMLLAARGTQDGLQVLEYTSTATGVAGDLYELSKGTGALGRLGTGLNVLGGVSLAANALLGQMGLSPADLRAAANLIVEPELLPERELIIGFIREYQAATEKSHYINTFIGGVGYVASFAGPLGKGLSYVATVGGSTYSSAIGSEYESWGNSIVSMIRSALAKQERLLAKKKKLNEPNWKIDPSGYVFEAAESERIAGVTATVLLQDGDGFRVWSESEEWDEVNPQTTDSQGKFGWDVPTGEWKVRFESPAYQTYETKSMSVPPLHDQVNIGLLAKAVPLVTGVVIHPDALVVSFDRYMLPNSLVGNVLISGSDGKAVLVREIVPIAPVENTGYTGAGDYSDLVINATCFAKQFKVIPDTPTGGFAQFQDDGETAAHYSVRLLSGIASYAQVPLAATYESDALTVTERAIIPIRVRATAASKVYGSADPELGYEVIAGDFAPGDQLSGKLTRDAGENAGSYPITQGTLSGGEKYEITFEAGSLAITPRAITVTADSRQKYAGSAEPALSWRITSGSLVGNDSLSGALGRAPGENVGSYAINQGTLSAGNNYLLTFVPAALSIVAPPAGDVGDGGGGGATTQPGNPVVPETPGAAEQLALEGREETDAAGRVVGMSYTAPEKLAAAIAATQAEGVNRYELHLAGEAQSDATLPRSLTIPNSALLAAASKAEFVLTISSAAGSISLPPALLQSLAASGQPLGMIISRLEEPGELPARASAVAPPLEVRTSLRGRTGVRIPLQLQLPDDPTARAAFLHSLSVFAVHSSGEQDLIHDLQFTIDENISPAVLQSVSFQVDQFSSFTLVKFASEALTTKVGVPGYSIAGVRRDLPACFYQQGDTLMPLRMLEEYGVVFAWNAASKTVLISYRGKVVSLTVGSTAATVDGQEQQISGASGRPLSPLIRDGRAMLPLRFVSEVLGFQVHWDPSHLITIRP